MTADARPTRFRSLPLLWQVVLVNGSVLLVGTLVLALAPVTVSPRARAGEVMALGVGVAAVVAANALLLRPLLHPHEELRALERLAAEGSRSSARTLAAQEEERQRVAQELHDEVGQSLTAVLLGLKAVIDDAPPELVARLTALQDTTRGSLEEVRRISQRLRPGMLEDLGLLSSLSSLASDFTRATGLPVVRGFTPGLPALPREKELVVYRVTQEALTNAARHAAGTRVELGLTRRGGVLELRVADDGVGLRDRTTRPAAEGTGLAGMRERAALVGGSLQVRPRAGGGTEVLLIVPLEGR